MRLEPLCQSENCSVNESQLVTVTFNQLVSHSVSQSVSQSVMFGVLDHGDEPALDDGPRADHGRARPGRRCGTVADAARW